MAETVDYDKLIGEMQQDGPASSVPVVTPPTQEAWLVERFPEAVTALALIIAVGFVVRYFVAARHRSWRVRDVIDLLVSRLIILTFIICLAAVALTAFGIERSTFGVNAMVGLVAGSLIAWWRSSKGDLAEPFPDPSSRWAGGVLFGKGRRWVMPLIFGYLVLLLFGANTAYAIGSDVLAAAIGLIIGLAAAWIVRFRTIDTKLPISSDHELMANRFSRTFGIIVGAPVFGAWQYARLDEVYFPSEWGLVLILGAVVTGFLMVRVVVRAIFWSLNAKPNRT